jgi:hypothetical protein
MASLDFVALNAVADKTRQPVVEPPISDEELSAILATALRGLRLGGSRLETA